MNYIVGVDIGGTFTDCVVVDELGAITIGKALSTPADFSQGALAALGDAAMALGLRGESELLASTSLFFHACTIGENTLITRSGPRTGLLTTKGFADIIHMMRGKAAEGLTESEAAHLSMRFKPEPLVPRELVGEVLERVDYQGAPIVPLDEAGADDVIARLMARGVESVAVSLLWSVANDTHERALADLLRSKYPGVFVSASSEVAPYVGEYERTATTVINAYIGPKVSSYLARLGQALGQKGLRRDPLIMQAYGGVLSVEATRRSAVGTIESGPAAGVVGSQFLGDLTGQGDILATDMGGTTFKVGVIRAGKPEKNHSPLILRYRTLLPKLWIESIGAGGGSIAWVDHETRIPKVGPQSAGAEPGPACYALGGTEPTVSDADLVLGYLNSDYFLGGRMALDRARAVRAIQEKAADPLGMSVTEAALGIYKITNAHMADLLRRVTIERGYDPRGFVLFVYGGAGPVHGSRYAAELGIRQVVIPYAASVQGAMGLVCSDVVYEYGRSDHLLFPGELERINRNFSELAARAGRDLRSNGFGPEEVLVRRSLDIRYRFQVHDLTVPLPDGTRELSEADLVTLDGAFDALYEQLYGNGAGYREVGKEIVSFRLTAIGPLPRPSVQRGAHRASDATSAVKGRRAVFFEEYGEFVPVDTLDFSLMTPGMAIAGPAIIETPVTTVVVNPQDFASMDEFRNIRLTVGA